MNNNYAVVEHWQDKHRELEEPPDYKYQLISSHRTATERQIWESLYIENEKCDIILKLVLKSLKNASEANQRDIQFWTRYIKKLA